MSSVQVPSQPPPSPSKPRAAAALAASSPPASFSRSAPALVPATPIDPIPLLRTSQALLALLGSQYAAVASIFPAPSAPDESPDDAADAQHRRAREVLQKLEVTKLLTNLELARPVLAHARDVALGAGAPPLAPLPRASGESRLAPGEAAADTQSIAVGPSAASGVKAAAGGELPPPPPPQSADVAAWLSDLGARTMDLRLVVRAREMEVEQREAARKEARRVAEEAAAVEAEHAAALRDAGTAPGDETDALFGRRRPVAAASGDGRSAAALTDEDKVLLQQNVQESLAGEVLSLVATIKQNALKFSEAINQDSAVLQDASGALEKSSGSMGAVGQRLNAYRKSGAIGWWFYIMAVVAMIVALSAGMIIIRLFPKW